MLSMRPKLPKQSCSSAECCEMLRVCVREGTCKILQDNEWHVWFAVYFEHRNEMFLGQTSRFPNYHYTTAIFDLWWIGSNISKGPGDSAVNAVLPMACLFSPWYGLWISHYAAWWPWTFEARNWWEQEHLYNCLQNRATCGWSNTSKDMCSSAKDSRS